ncbi:hypothetical protein LI328DRAFT_127320, partial [Trichoderma asperelloides]
MDERARALGFAACIAIRAAISRGLMMTLALSDSRWFHHSSIGTACCICRAMWDFLFFSLLFFQRMKLTDRRLIALLCQLDYEMQCWPLLLFHDSPTEPCRRRALSLSLCVCVCAILIRSHISSADAATV